MVIAGPALCPVPVKATVPYCVSSVAVRVPIAPGVNRIEHWPVVVAQSATNSCAFGPVTVPCRAVFAGDRSATICAALVSLTGHPPKSTGFASRSATDVSLTATSCDVESAPACAVSVRNSGMPATSYIASDTVQLAPEAIGAPMQLPVSLHPLPSCGGYCGPVL